jgi:hypothetical protein
VANRRPCSLLVCRDRVWNVGGESSLQFPQDGHRLLAEIEGQSFWVRHRNRVIERLLAAARRPTVMSEVGSGIDRPGDAALAYQRALVLEPGQLAWRFQFAEFLLVQGRLREAWEQLWIILASQPAYAAARALLDAVDRGGTAALAARFSWLSLPNCL